MPNLLQRIISQLDMLVPYLSLAHEEIFDLVESEYDEWCPTPDETPLPSTFDAFTVQIAHAAFVLGSSYADAFFADLLREIYRKHPRMLSQNKKLSFDTIVSAGDYGTVVSRMVDHEVHEIMHNGLADVAKHFDTRLSIVWPESELQELVTASLIRNCIIHNNSIADQRLAARSDWNVSDLIALSVSNVHEFGIAARIVVRRVYQEAEDRHLSRDAT